MATHYLHCTDTVAVLRALPTEFSPSHTYVAESATVRCSSVRVLSTGSMRVLSWSGVDWDAEGKG